MTAVLRSVAMIGDGGWGTALAMLLAEEGHAVRLWGHDPAYLEELDRTRQNRKFLPGFSIPREVAFEPDLDRALLESDLAIVAVPSNFLRATLERARGAVGVPVLSVAKGMEEGSLARPSAVIAEVWGARGVAVLSGPSHAEEVAGKLPCTVVLAAEDAARAEALRDVLISPRFRVYSSTDVAGVELGGALKNVIAVAVGICEGLGLGDNARAALMTRGLAEMTRLGTALGGRPETFAGLSGMGDLITTCVSPYGRNRAVGLALAQGRSLEAVLAATEQVAEGVHTCGPVCALARAKGVEMPISEALLGVLHGALTPREAVGALMTRAPRAE
ncbi:MAG: NAD(P)H-dependent glycerol-3-phosphate dehydrogenase [Planctomycetota bacterium]